MTLTPTLTLITYFISALFCMLNTLQLGKQDLTIKKFTDFICYSKIFIFLSGESKISLVVIIHKYDIPIWKYNHFTLSATVFALNFFFMETCILFSSKYAATY